MSWRTSQACRPVRDADAPFIHVEADDTGFDDTGFPAILPAGGGAGRRGGFPTVVRRRLTGALRRLSDSRLGDAIGCACLFALLWAGLIVAWVLE